MITRYDFATPTYIQALALRNEVLRIPLGLDINNDDLAGEYDQVHFAAWEEGQLVGTASLAQVERKLKMRQVAVAEHQQGRGVGQALVRACEAYARSTEARELYCHARLVAQPFYERCDWTPFGKTFSEVGIEHVRMRSPHVGAPAGR